MIRNPKRFLVLLALILITLMIAVTAYVAISLYLTGKRIPAAYAAWTTADLIIDHMEANGGVWPKGWEDLELAAELRAARGEPVRWPVEELPTLVSVDWRADPSELVRAEIRNDERPFAVVSRRDGSAFKMVWEGHEPNQMILDYLLAHELPLPTYSPATFRADIGHLIGRDWYSDAVAYLATADPATQVQYDPAGYLAIAQDMILLPRLYPDVEVDRVRDWCVPGTSDAIESSAHVGWQIAATDFAQRYNVLRGKPE